MARDITALFNEVYAHYPTALGDSGQDTTLQAVLVRFTNSLFNRIDRDRRWSLSYQTAAQVTTAGLSLYAFPASLTTISHCYWLDTTGQPRELDSYDAQELRRRFGDSSAAQPGPPQAFAVEGSNVQIFPAPDSNGPTGGNYTILFEGYTTITPIVQTSGTTTAANATLTVPSTGYLSANGVATTGTYLSVVGAGYLGALSVADTHFTGWSAFASATQVTMTSNAITAISNTKVFFNSLNWVIADFDHVVLFGLLRDVAAYLKENFQLWDIRFQDAYEDMARHDVDRRKTLEARGVGVTGQNQMELRARRNPYDTYPYWGW